MPDTNINEVPLWIGFIIFILVMLFLDLKVFHRKSEKVSVKNALVWSAIWIVMALTFGVVIYLFWVTIWVFSILPDTSLRNL